MIPTAIVDAGRYLLAGGETRADRYALGLFYSTLLVIAAGALPVVVPSAPVVTEAVKWIVWGTAVGVGAGVLVQEREAFVERTREMAQTDRGGRP